MHLPKQTNFWLVFVQTCPISYLPAITRPPRLPFLKEGIGFECDHLALSQSIGGVFTNKDDRYDPARHQVNLNLRVGDPVKEALTRVPVQKVKSSVPLPQIDAVYDRKSRSTDHRGKSIVWRCAPPCTEAKKCAPAAAPNQ